MHDHYKFYEYQITEDPEFQHERFGIGPEQVKLLESTAIECRNKNNKTIIPRLTQLIAEYPTIPMFYNFLSVAYNLRGNYEKSAEVNDLLFTNHPDYLFGRINKVNYLIEEGRLEEIPDLLGKDLELKLLYPERNVFHIGEITSYLNVVIRYCAVVKNLELAENRLKLLKDLDPEGPMTEQAESFLLKLRIETSLKRLEENAKQRITPVVPNLVTITNKEDAPIFNHSEINNLYKYGLRIPHALLKEILALPRQTLISDLELVLNDAIERYHYFLELDYDEETQNFPVHAMFLLKELESVSSLPKILEFLSLNDEILDFWLGDHRTDSLWQCIYSLGFDQTIILKRFLISPGIDTYSKTLVSDALSQMALHYPERRMEISSIYAEVFNIFLESSVEDNLVDTEFLGLAISDTIDSGLRELLPIIKKLYEKNYVGIGINGTSSNVEKIFNSPPRRSYIKEPLSIYRLYKHILDHWSGYNENDDFGKASSIPKPAESVKTGRNDPCPCGSGKKYKKCCME